MERNNAREKMILPFTAIPNILVRERFLDSHEKLLLAYIASMGATGLTISVKHLRRQLAPIGNTGLLRAIKRLQFLGMIRIEAVPKRNGEPAYKKPCHRYFFVKDPTEWIHTVDFRTKVKMEVERMENPPTLHFKTDVFLDDKHLNDAFTEWLRSTRPAPFQAKPQASAVTPSAESKKWIAKIQKLKNGEMTFLRIADDAISYVSYLEALTPEEETTVCREKLAYMNLIFDFYESAVQNPPDEQTRKDLDWIEEMKQQGLSSVEISRNLLRENSRRLKGESASTNGEVSREPSDES